MKWGDIVSGGSRYGVILPDAGTEPMFSEESKMPMVSYLNA